MAKSKYAPALFEVIHSRQDAKSGEGGGRLSLPKWWKREAPAEPPSRTEPDPPPDLSPPASAAESPRQAEETVDPGREGAIPSPATPRVSEPVREAPRFAAATAADLVDAPPLLQVREGRLALSLNPVSAAVVVGVALIALFTSYQLGRSSGYGAAARSAAAPASQDEVERIVNGPAKPEVIRAAAPSKTARSTAAPAARPPTAQAGSAKPPVEAAPAVAKSAGYSVVLEHFKPEHGQAAEFAQKWLEQQGCRTRLERRSDGWRLISAEALADEPQVRKYMERVPQLGNALGPALGRAGHPIYYMKKPMTVKEK